MPPFISYVGNKSFLSDYLYSRNNNFNLLRFIAAAAVLVSHAWPIVLGPGTKQPLEEATGSTLGHYAVVLFFAVSGFLITGSLLREGNFARFSVARALRIFPGLFVSILFVALLMGPFVTELPLAKYYTDRDLFSFIIRNTIIIHPQYTLLDTFQYNPYKAIEGSIWTLPHEIFCYVTVFALGVFGLLRRKYFYLLFFIPYVLAYSIVEIYELSLPGKLESFRSLSLPFIFGMIMWLESPRIRLDSRYLAGIFLACIALIGTPFFEAASTILIGYAAVFFAFTFSGEIRRFNLIGDYSYGMYIYAFPIQGFFVWLLGGENIAFHIAISFLTTLCLSILSWHLVEKPCLDQTAKFTRLVRKLLVPEKRETVG